MEGNRRERVHFISGEIPFLAERVDIIGMPEGLSCVRLLETIDHHSAMFLAAGTLLVAKPWELDKAEFWRYINNADHVRVDDGPPQPIAEFMASLPKQNRI